MFTYIKWWIRLALVGLLLASCKNNPTSTPALTQASYPVTTVTQAYPAPETPFPGAIAFQFDRPVKANATQITGNAPAGVVLNIVNITLMGEVLGSGVVGPDNRFAISVTPLVANIRVGIEVIDTGSSGHAYEDFNNKAYQGEGAVVMPQVGYFLDTVLVEPLYPPHDSLPNELSRCWFVLCARNNL